MVWSGQTFGARDARVVALNSADLSPAIKELVRRLDGHLGFVKGVVFDPAGQFLASQVSLRADFTRRH